MLSAHQVASTLTSRYFATIDADAQLQKSTAALQLRSSESQLHSLVCEVIDATVDVLERDIALLAFADALVAEDVKTLDDVRLRGAAIMLRANATAGFDIAARLPEGAVGGAPVAPIDFLRIRSILADAVHSRLKRLPLKSLVVFARELQIPERAHRLRRAFETLLALSLRASAEWEPQLKQASQLYLAGRLEIPEIARLVGVSASEIAAEFERLGVLRSTQVLVLSDAERQTLLEKISSEPVEDAVRRELVASQRIEGIDARSHLDRLA